MHEEAKKRQDHLQFLKSLDKVNQAIQGTPDLHQMMNNVLDVVLSIFDCDRAFLLYPCDPEASSWRIPMERTKAEYPGAHAAGLEVPTTAEVAKVRRLLLETRGPVHFGPESEYALPSDTNEQFNIKSHLAMAIYPKVGAPWQVGLHQCSHARSWTPSDKELFKAIGHRIADGLSVLLSYKAVSENRTFLDNIFENIPSMVFVKDAKDLRYMRLNKAGEKLLGFSQQELIGKNDYDFFTKAEADFFTAKDREALDRKELVDIPEETIHTKYGERLLHTKKIPLFDKTGKPVYLLGISEDITERKQMVEASQSSEKRLLLAAEAAQMGLWDWNIITGEVIWSDQCKAHYGYPPETSMSHELFLQALHPDDRERVDAALNRAVKERSSYKITKRTVWPDGSIHWTNSRGQVYCDNSGEPVRMVGITFDITERKRIEKEHQAYLYFLESMEKINQVIQSAPEFEQMMGDLLDAVLSIFDCDRAWFLYPCDPDTRLYRVPYEKTTPEYPGACERGMEIPVDNQLAEVFQKARSSSRPVLLYPDSSPPLPVTLIEQFQVQTQMSMIIYPKVDKPYMFGLHQCAYARVWTDEEERLFKEIGMRLTDTLSILLSNYILRESEEKYRLIAENTADVITILDLNLRPMYVSPSVKSLRGYTAREAMNQQLNEVLTPESLKKVEQVFAHHMELEKDPKAAPDRSEILELEEYHKEGYKIWVELAASIIRGKDSRATGILAITRDITERKQAELQLIESERKFRSLAESSPDNIMRYDAKGRLIYINRNMEQAVGIDLRSLIGKKPVKHLDIEPPKGFLSKLKKVIETGKPDEIEIEVQNPKGEIRTHHIRFAAERNNQREIIGVLAIGHDVTGRKRAEENLRNLSQAIEQSPVSIVITDVAGRIEFVNTTFTQITGYTYAEALGKHTRILKSGKTPLEQYSQLWETISSGGVWRGEFHNRKKNGELFWEHATIAPVKDADNVISHYVAVKEDITERKKLEAQLYQSQKMEAVGQLAGGVAHDFNNMLGVIIGHTELAMQNATADDSLREHLKEILAASFRSAEITRQLLAFARKQTIVPKILDLNDTLEGMLKLLRRLIGEDIDLVWLPGTNLWRVKMDPSQIDQILVNLCVNAKDAIGGVGKVTIETQKVVLDDAYCADHKGFVPGEYVKLAVSDNGRGMEKQTLDKIFEPFFTTKGVGKGTGLGLATVYGIIKQNAGFINVYSEPGYGTTFRIYMPRHKDEIDHEPEAILAPKAAQGHETVLVVEDEPLQLEMVKCVLEDYGYRVLVASSPSEALLVVKAQTGIHLLLSDMIMPEINGQDLAKKVISLVPDIKCLFMSGYTGDFITQHGLLDEGFNFIQKPFSKQALAVKVREVLDSK